MNKKLVIMIAVAAVIALGAWAQSFSIPSNHLGKYVGPGLLQQQRSSGDTLSPATWTPTRDAAIVAIRFHTETVVPSTAILTIDVNDADDAFDFNLVTEEMNGLTDLLLRYDPPINLVADTVITMTFVHPGSSVDDTGLEFIYSDRS